MKNKPKILFLDIETAPISAYVWGIWDQNIGLNQIIKDWCIISWAAKWRGNRKLFYQDQRSAKDVRNDKNILKGIWKLLNEADIIVTHNGKKFDQKKLNSRFLIWNMKPPSSVRHIDTLEISKRYFGFTSNKLEYLTEKLCKKKKYGHKKFPGQELWNECLKGNKSAWREMERYNKIDVTALEELYERLLPYVENMINFNVYSDDLLIRCACGSTEFQKYGYWYTNTGKFQRTKCKKCGKESKHKKNLLTADKKKVLREGKK